MTKAAKNPEENERETPSPSGRLFQSWSGSGSRGGRGPRAFLDRETGFRGWTATIPGGRELTTPAIDGGRLFLGAGYGSYAFYAFEAESGQMLWGQRTRDDGPTAAAVSDGYVAFNTESCTICVLDAISGRTVWERWLGDPLLGQPAVAGGRVYMAWPAGGDHRLGAFDLATGRPLWDAGVTSDVITAPVFSEGELYASTYDGQVWCFDAATGVARWQRELRATSAPWVWKGEVFLSQREPGSESQRGAYETTAHWKRGAAERKLHAARRAHYLHSKRGTRMYMQDLRADASVGFGSAPHAAKLHMAERMVGEASVRGAWRFQGSRPCVWNGTLFTSAGDVLSASDVASGEEHWRWKAPEAADHERALSPPAAVNGRVYAGSRDGRIRSWDAQSGELRWSVPVGESANWQPAVSGGWVYGGLPGGRITAFQTGDALDDGWPMWGGGAGHNGS